MAYDERLAERIREALADEKAVDEIKMMGGLCFMVERPHGGRDRRRRPDGPHWSRKRTIGHSREHTPERWISPDGRRKGSSSLPRPASRRNVRCSRGSLPPSPSWSACPRSVRGPAAREAGPTERSGHRRWAQTCSRMRFSRSRSLRLARRIAVSSTVERSWRSRRGRRGSAGSSALHLPERPPRCRSSPSGTGPGRCASSTARPGRGPAPRRCRSACGPGIARRSRVAFRPTTAGPISNRRK